MLRLGRFFGVINRVEADEIQVRVVTQIGTAKLSQSQNRKMALSPLGELRPILSFQFLAGYIEGCIQANFG